MTNLDRVLQEVVAAEDFRKLHAVCNRFNEAIAKLTPREREKAFERFDDALRERSSCRNC